MPKLRIEEAAARTQARIDSGKQTVIGVNKIPARRTKRRSTCSRSTTPRCAQLQIDKLRGSRRERDPAGGRGGARGADPRARPAATATCWRSRSMPRAPRRRSARFHGAGEGVRPPPGRDQVDLRRLQAEVGHDRAVERVRRDGRRLRAARRPPPAHPGRQDRPGRPRPRPEGDRVGLRRSRLRRRYRRRCSRRPRRRRARRSRTTCISSACPRSPRAT